MSEKQISADVPHKNPEVGTGPAVSDAQRLSQSLFANPHDFLNTLKKDFNDYDQHHTGAVTKEDLYYYAKTGGDPTAKAAAQLAYEHYDQLIDFEQGAQYNSLALKDYATGTLTQNGLGVDVALVSGQKNSVIFGEVAKDTVVDLAMAGTTALTGTLALLSLPELPVAAGMGSIAGLAGAVTAGISYETYKAPEVTTNRANVETKAINSWIHGA